MHLKGSRNVITDNGYFSFEQEVIFTITDIRPAMDGKPENEGELNKIKITLMSLDGDVTVIEMEAVDELYLMYENIILSKDFSGFKIIT